MWRRILPVCLVAGLAVGQLVVPALAGVSEAACADRAGTERAAVELAVSCDRPVTVDSSRTEFSQVTAQPDGHLRFESAVEPQRARRGAEWADLDLSLTRGGDGQLRPAVSVADVAFSGGGSGPLITLTRGGRTLTMSWPGNLPLPTVSDDSATYAEVLPGVDLVVRATSTGFTHALVVKSAAAAAQPGVANARFRLGGTARISSKGGLLTASGPDTPIASTEPAVMWDSRTTPTTPSKVASARPQAAPRSTHKGPGDAARVAPVSVALAGDDLVLRPDAKLLKSATYPLYVDPAWSVYKNKWAYATSNNSNNTDYSRARVGLSPDSGALYRSYFQFPTTANGVSLAKKHIETARVEMKLDHSWSCDSTITSMYWTSAINATPKASWSAMSLLRFVDTATGHANEAGGCGNEQGDMYMQFDSAAVTQLLQDAANGSWSALTVALTARAADGTGESVQERWKKFYPNDAKLVVDYDTPPGKPLYLQAAGVACNTGVLSIGTLTPTFSAIFSDADASDSLTGVFEWIEVPAGGMSAVTDTSPARKTPPPNKTNISPKSTRATTATVTAVKGKTYAFRARAIDKAPYSISSGWGPWCQFTVDTTVPPVTATVITQPAGPGQKGRIRIESTATDVTKFQYGWDAATKVVTASGTNPKYAEVDITAPAFGLNVLLLKAIDATLNEGNGSLEFRVGRPSPAAARWTLETYPGINQTAALADQAASPANTPLTASGVTWTDGVRLIGGQTATFNGTSSAATTSSAVVNTTGSFSVSAWVRLGVLPAGDLKFATQDGPDAAGFEIGVRRNGSPATPYWSFVMKDTSAQTSTTVAALSPTAITAADVGRWTLVTGAFDATEKKLKLYVDGTLVGQADRTATPWSAAGKFAVGRGFASGVVSNFWNGSIADVQVFDRVLQPQDFSGQLASDPASGGFDEPGIATPIEVGSWDFQSAVPCYLADLRDTCEAPDTRTAWGRWLALSRGAEIGAGHSASEMGLWTDNRYFPEEGNTSYSDEYGRSAVKAGTTPPDADGLEFTTWQDRAVLRTDQSYTISAWVMLEPGPAGNGGRTVFAQRGTHESAFWLKYSPQTQQWEFRVLPQDDLTATPAGVSSLAAAEQGVWTQLTGVYDSATKEIRLYVNGELQNTRTLSFTPFNATGPLLVGHTLWHDGLMDQFYGGIDDVEIYQGAMSDAAVAAMYDRNAADVSGANVLGVGQALHTNEALRSNNRQYTMWMQVDGNVKLYDGATEIWSTRTYSYPGASMVMRADGNLVIYSAAGAAVWSTGTAGTGADRLVLYDDGDLVLLDSTGQVVWRRD
ncbi:LamG-like jellyroll fold domain-containing protein [Actinoplanes sp. CA-142083]|uniref:LamG-like jellyroll fold domain-containing protein n=1 Tax=Actinoplanes sp. CA-142083 TaxID=3239903 RepID=UPI003D943BF4